VRGEDLEPLGQIIKKLVNKNAIKLETVYKKTSRTLGVLPLRVYPKSITPPLRAILAKSELPPGYSILSTYYTI
jgi:hypothetical protein